MASYHLAVKTVQRSAGRTATAAAAYRHAARIDCDREGRVHDYRAKSGVEASFIVAPDAAPDWVRDRAALWNAAEARETRVNGLTAREWELALPAELDAEGRRQLVAGFAAALVSRYGVAADVAIHAPHREGDQRNWHAHVLTTTRAVTAEGLAEKTRVLDAKQTGGPEIAAMREAWAGMQNAALERHGSVERVDHRSLEAQRAAAVERGDERAAEALERPAETKLGPAASAVERREKRAAEREGRDYAPVTDRGARVHAAREARGLVAELAGIRDALRERVQDEIRARSGLARAAYAGARDEGAGRVTAGLAALRAAAQRQGIGQGAGQGREREAERAQPGDWDGRQHAEGIAMRLRNLGPVKGGNTAASAESVRARLERIVGRDAEGQTARGQGLEEESAMERPEPVSALERRDGPGRRVQGTEDVRERLDAVLGRAARARSVAEQEREQPDERTRHREDGHGWEL